MTPQIGAITENIALLSLLGEALEVPAVNEEPKSLKNQYDSNQRSIPFKHEKQIAEAFAVLLAHTDNKNKVGGVSIEERPDINGLLIRTAVNKGEQEGRKNVFQTIAGTIISASTIGNLQSSDNNQRLTTKGEPIIAEQENQLLDKIVGSCQLRLLKRLRSHHAAQLKPPVIPKPPAIPKLYQATRYLSSRGDTPTKLLRDQATSLNNSFTSLENLSFEEAHSTRGRELIKSILYETERMLKTPDFVSILKSIPKEKASWCSADQDEVTKPFDKLHQYLKAARYLLRVARKFSIFQNLVIEEVSKEPFTDGLEGLDLDSRGLLSRFKERENEIIIQRLSQRFEQKMSKLAKRVLKVAQMSKRVHAEIQLLFFYEKHPEIVPRPRVICSNKRACYLCNLFIKVHSDFYTPETHGRLYPQWRLPTVIEMPVAETGRLKMMDCLHKFSDALESKIQSCLQGRQKLGHPAESIIFNPASNTVSVVAPSETVRRFTSDEGVDGLETPRAHSPARSNHSSTATIKAGQIDGIADVATSETLIPSTANSPSSSRDLKSTSYAPRVSVTQSHSSAVDGSVYNLSPGIPLKLHITPGLSIKFHTSTIRLEYVTDKAPLDQRCLTSKLDNSLEIEWIPEEKATSLEGQGRTIAVDLLSEIVNVEDMLFTPEGLWLRAKDCILSLKAMGTQPL